ncbi:MAG: glycosyltransferase family 9 protein [Candidatus Omnitrophica bacterium]|nr:glycosyltransferase family 9 protein [Candidatus Omnitrophota bacterium]
MILKRNAGQRYNQRILIINPFGIGDVLFTTPLVSAIRQNFPQAFIGYWCNERVEAVLRNNPDINKVFALSRGDIKKIYKKSWLKGVSESLKLFRALKKERFDTVFDFSLDHRYGLVSRLIGAKQRIGFNYKNRGKFLTKKIDIDGFHGKHIVEFYLDLLRICGIEQKSADLKLGVSNPAKESVKNLLGRFGVRAGDMVVGIAPGAGGSWGKDAVLKHWPALKFALLADRILEDLKAKVLIIGDESERPIANTIFEAMKHKPIDLTGKTSLEEFAAIMGKLKVLVTNDGGPMHMAVALGTKTVSIFGPVDEKVYGPYPKTEQHIVVKEEIFCRPCYKNFRMPKCQRDRECIKSIEVDKVFEAVREVLKA